MNLKMKYLILFPILLALITCQEPAPVELVNEQEVTTELEIINESPGSYSVTGYDSTGVIDEVTYDKSLVLYSGVKNTLNKLTRFSGFGEAIFINSSEPITNSNDNIVGYKSIDFGEVLINNHKTEVVPYSLKYYDNFSLVDTLVGVKNVLYHRGVSFPSLLNFPYNKNIPISFKDKNGRETLMVMRMPEEIVGDIQVKGLNDEENFELSISWNPSDFGTVDIIIGTRQKITDSLNPLFRIKNPSRNTLVIPNNLIREILRTDIKYLIFTFIRKVIEEPQINNLGDIYFASQSIHNIWIEIN